MLRFINSFTIADGGLCTKNTSRALIERPYSCAPQAVGAVYDRPGFFVQSPKAQKGRHILPPLLGTIRTSVRLPRASFCCRFAAKQFIHTCSFPRTGQDTLCCFSLFNLFFVILFGHVVPTDPG